MDTILPAVVAFAAFAAVLLPLMRERAATAAGRSDPATLEAEVERYRASLRAGSLCGRCSEANPAGSRFCGRCGTRLAD